MPDREELVEALMALMPPHVAEAALDRLENTGYRIIGPGEGREMEKTLLWRIDDRVGRIERFLMPIEEEG